MTVKPSQTDALANLLQQAELRHQVISQNVANVNTPGYRSQQIHFADAFGPRTDSGAETGGGRVADTPGLTARADGNNVDLDRELGNMTKNALHFETFSHLLVARFSMMKSAITGT